MVKDHINQTYLVQSDSQEIKMSLPQKIIFIFHFLFFFLTRHAFLGTNAHFDFSRQWSLVCDSAWKVHIAKFSLLVGSIFGYLVFGILADW